MIMPKEKAMADDERNQAETCATYLKALAEPTRYQIVKALCAGSMTVSDIAALVEQDITTVSHHLRVLYHAEIATTERDGRHIYYSLNHKLISTRRKLDELNFGCCKLELSK
jgi:DNA-binding transcriptional ArsR family regulator